MKKKTALIIACIVSLVFGFTGCGTSTFGMVVNDELNIEITAENADEDMTSSTGTFTVGEGDDVHIEPNFQEGEVLVEFYPVAAEDVNADVEEMMPEGEPEFEVEVTGTEPIECGFAAGDYMVKATVLKKANGTAVISLITQEEKDPWTKVSSAAEAAKGAGNMEDFEVPQDLQINDLTFSDPAFSYLDGVAQATYESGAIGVYVRKACGIYGGPMTDRDLKSFPEHWTQQVGDDGDDVVDCYGMSKDSAIVIQWGDTEEFYTVTSQGLGGEEYGMDAATVTRLEDVID